jgi:hypothetical protein
MQLAAKIRDARTTRSHRRTERRAHRQLAGELATFTSPAQRAELESVLERHTPEETAPIREILTRHDIERQLSGRRS